MTTIDTENLSLVAVTQAHCDAIARSPQELGRVLRATVLGFVRDGVDEDPDEGPVWRWRKPRPSPRRP